MPASAASVAWNTDSVEIVLASSGTEYDLELRASRQERHVGSICCTTLRGTIFPASAREHAVNAVAHAQLLPGTVFGCISDMQSLGLLEWTG